MKISIPSATQIPSGLVRQPVKLFLYFRIRRSQIPAENKQEIDGAMNATVRSVRPMGYIAWLLAHIVLYENLSSLERHVPHC
jgi:hypothetical protein